MNYTVLCSVALYKMKYLRPAPKCGWRSYPAAAGCSLQWSTGPFADRSLCLICAGEAKNLKQPEFYVDPK